MLLCSWNFVSNQWSVFMTDDDLSGVFFGYFYNVALFVEFFVQSMECIHD